MQRRFLLLSSKMLHVLLVQAGQAHNVTDERQSVYPVSFAKALGDDKVGACMFVSC